jgi:hypothetical protein
MPTIPASSAKTGNSQLSIPEKLALALRVSEWKLVPLKADDKAHAEYTGRIDNATITVRAIKSLDKDHEIHVARDGMPWSEIAVVNENNCPELKQLLVNITYVTDTDAFPLVASSLRK